MCYSYCLWYSFEEWNDLPVIRCRDKFRQDLGTIQTFDNKKIEKSAILYEFSNDK